MEIGIRTMNVESAEEEFLSIFQGGEWLLKIIKKAKEMQTRDNLVITDILIREGNVPFFGTLKNFYPVVVPDERMDGLVDIVRPGREQILSFMETYLRLTDQDTSILREKTSLDFSLLFYGKGNMRINFSRDANGLSLNIRLLDFVVPELEDVKYPDIYSNFIKSLVVKNRVRLENKELEVGTLKAGGLILHAGPTGSGKTTCVFAELNYFLENTSGLIITYENPIEYRFLGEPRVKQIELYTHLHPKHIYYHFLRNSPLIGMISEVKTAEEFLQVLDLASRGHLVITTIHANDALEAVYMFLSMIGREYTPMFLSTLRAVVCHRLVLSREFKIVPVYEVLLPDDVIKKHIEDWEFKALENHLYKNRTVNKEAFYSFDDSIRQRTEEGLLSLQERERLRRKL